MINNQPLAGHERDSQKSPITGGTSSPPLEDLFRDLDAIRHGKAVPEHGIPAREKFARAIEEEPKYRS